MDAADGIPQPQRTWAHAAVILGIMMSVLDSAIANIALPTLAAEFQVRPADAIWIVSAYQLAVTAALLPIASLGDILGYKRVFCAGLALFTLASLACSLSTSLPGLAAARAVQGLGAAGIMSVNNALIRFIYPHRLLGRGISYNALMVAISSVAGPTVAASILSWGSWPWLFWVNVPVGILALAVGFKVLPRTPQSTHPFDTISAILNALTFGLLLIGADSLLENGPVAALELGGAVLLGFVFVRRQRSLKVPMLPLDLLRIRIFSLSVMTSMCSFAAQTMAYVALPFYFQNVMGRSQGSIGALMTAWPLLTAVISPISGRLSDRHSAGLLGGIGLGILAVGLGTLALLPTETATIDIVWRLALCGLGFGLFQAPNNRAIFTSAPRERSGGANGMQATARLVGQTTGAALVALIFSAASENAASLSLAIAAALAITASIVSSLRAFSPAAGASSQNVDPHR
ncbi:MFS transporter [Microvirga puerhi]|uniref:MFS transporter n=1 Tax=Microvirga puerhi TaxID=2876078 RepID=A0ABS7VNU1_9HYPH|nr:MFS transporter [Microvirga puerhi]MBZ6076795.1 MFS transporter [Microvirga puerhi]